MTATNVPRLTKVGDVDWSNIDAAFCCLPHATTQEILNSLPKHIKVVDLSADFRLKDIKMYAEWYALIFAYGGPIALALCKIHPSSGHEAESFSKLKFQDPYLLPRNPRLMLCFSVFCHAPPQF